MNDLENIRTERQITMACNEVCTCGGGGPENGCPACKMWHYLFPLGPCRDEAKEKQDGATRREGLRDGGDGSNRSRPTDGNKGGRMTAKEKLLKIVLNAKGDNLERAECAFRGLAEAQLAEQYGQSGNTRKEILKEYREERREWEAAYELAKQI